MASGLYCSLTAQGIAFLDVRPGRGRWRILDPVGAQLWAKITSSGSVPAAIDELVDHWASRGVDRSQVRRDLTAVAQALSRSRLLVPAVRTPQPATLPEVRFATAAAGRLREQVAAQAGLALALTLLRCLPLRTTIAVARAASRLPGRPATIEQAEAAHAAARRAARYWPGRAACLEESLGAYLAGALTGRRT
ncbi:lasso peptide biosynthesis B2 protein [Streptomyces sp. HMX112]|uniref:lasso peptide biosynthesis B2 protein n=1 Tax=Streptomyces sp. HMX112 TaxID=3390850 RepID=UPI003A7F8ADA